MKDIVQDPIKVLLLTFVTCGIYGLIWIYQVSAALSQELPEEGINPGMILVLFFVTCGIYPLIWYYKMGEWLPKVGQKYGKTIENEGGDMDTHMTMRMNKDMDMYNVSFCNSVTL